ncbi:hypothetical protein [Lentzea sp. E54]|uniref:hypothetical protein n=1 Tax=Lentzea xerophila TaxID=3435883 RepID=UPI003DA5E227
MSENRLSVDTDALLRSGVDVLGATELAKSISRDLLSAVETYRDAGGTGEMGEQFERGYVPGAKRGVDFVNLLSDTLGDASQRTVDTAQSFSNSADEANAAASNTA